MTFDRVRRRNAVRPSPVFLLIVAITAAAGIAAWVMDDPMAASTRLAMFVLVIMGWIVSVCLHEFAHAYTAWRAGDHDVEARGYLTLDPLKYSHPLLSIGLPLVFIALGGIGLPGGAVYIRKHGFSPADQRRVSLAGPAVNAVCAIILLILIRTFGETRDHPAFWFALSFLAFLQITAFVLNILPVPGFDGYGALEPSLSFQTRRSLAQFADYGILIVFALLWLGPINEAFFSAIDHIFELSGIDSAWADAGNLLSRFWKHLGV